MDINKLISQFLEETRLLEDEQTLAVIAYGSRIKQTNRATSDLDIAIFSSRIGNYKKGMVIDGIKIDCNIFSIDDLFSLAYQKRLVNNRYFDSILKTGIILKNQDETVEMFKQYLEEMADIKIKKKQVSKKFIHELTELYLQFQVTQNSIWYYVLLEKIRMCYHYKNNCSYLSMVKVYAIYKGYYSEEDIFQLPSSSFVNTFLLSVETDKLEERFQLLDELLQISGLKLNKDLEEDSLSEKFIQPNEIKQKLYVLHNKLLIIKEYLVTHHPYGRYCYYNLLKQFYDFSMENHMEKEEVLDLYYKGIVAEGKEDMVSILERMFYVIESDYHFDYDNYMLKLVM